MDATIADDQPELIPISHVKEGSCPPNLRDEWLKKAKLLPAILEPLFWPKFISISFYSMTEARVDVADWEWLEDESHFVVNLPGTAPKDSSLRVNA